MKKAIASLQHIHDRILKKKENHLFFLGLFEYMDVLLKSSLFKNLDAKLKKTKWQDQELVDQLEKNVSSQLNTALKQIKSYLEKGHIDNKKINSFINEIEAILEGTLTTNLDSLTCIYHYLCEILQALVDQDQEHIRFVTKYADINAHNQAKNWKLSEDYIKWKASKKSFHRVKQSRIWFSRDKLLLFHEYFSQYESILHQEKVKTGNWKSFGHLVIFREIDEVLNQKQITEKYKYFDPDDMRMHLERLHQYILQPSEYELQKKCLYDPISGKLVIDQKEIVFGPNQLRGQILKQLFRKKNLMGNNFFFSEMFEEIQGQPPSTKKDRMKIYDAVKGISARLASDQIASDFLIYDTLQVRINSKYT